jgi:hypothetical protein
MKFPALPVVAGQSVNGKLEGGCHRRAACRFGGSPSISPGGVSETRSLSNPLCRWLRLPRCRAATSALRPRGSRSLTDSSGVRYRAGFRICCTMACRSSKWVLGLPLTWKDVAAADPGAGGKAPHALPDHLANWQKSGAKRGRCAAPPGGYAPLVPTIQVRGARGWGAGSGKVARAGFRGIEGVRPCILSNQCPLAPSGG